MAKVTRRSPRTQLDSALGVTRVTTAVVDDKVLFSKGELELLRKGEYSSNALTVEDADVFDAETMAISGYPAVVRPSYDFLQLSALVQANNCLLQAVAAMEVNEAGTGFEFERTDGKVKTKADEKKIADLRQFFDEPYPDTSFITMRRLIRRDLETTGNGYMEVIRGDGDEVVFLRRLDAKLMRLVRLDEPVVVDKVINRMGKETTVQMVVRERRFAMAVGKRLVFFREFGSSRKINRINGFWDDDARAEKLDEKNLGTEVIHFTLTEDATTNYGVPRWINQVPSVLGSREAELYNLEFFKHGGVPPVVFFLNGGSMDPASRTLLTDYMAGKAKNKQRGVVVEVATTGGTLDKAGTSGIVTERFGGEKQNDAMFLQYDERCANHIRESFRLPELFVGRSQDQNFATAGVGYLIAEAQVFKPERDEFDEIINVKIMRELAPDYRFRSKPVTLKDVATQLNAIGLVAAVVEVQQMIDAVNEISGLDLTMKEGADQPPDPMAGIPPELLAAAGKAPPPAGKPQLKSVPTAGKPPTPGGKAPKEVLPVEAVAKKSEIIKVDPEALTDLAEDWATYLSGEDDFSAEKIEAMSEIIGTLPATVRKMFNKSVGACMGGSAMAQPVADAIAAAGRAIVAKRLRKRADARPG